VRVGNGVLEGISVAVGRVSIVMVQVAGNPSKVGVEVCVYSSVGITTRGTFVGGGKGFRNTCGLKRINSVTPITTQMEIRPKTESVFQSRSFIKFTQGKNMIQWQK
jgi:hypothetical protein